MAARTIDPFWLMLVAALVWGILSPTWWIALLGGCGLGALSVILRNEP